MHYEQVQVPCKREDDGTEIYLTKFSCPASYSDKHILCVHGLTYTQHAFDMPYKDYSVVKFLASNGYTVWRLDSTGYGKSGKYDDGWKITSSHTGMDQVYAMNTILKETGMEKIDLLAWSWGTVTSAKCIAQMNDKLRKVVWLGPCFGGNYDPVPVKEEFQELQYTYVVRIWQHVEGSRGYDADYDTCERELHGIWTDEVYKHDTLSPRPNGGTKELMECDWETWLIDPDTIKVPVCMIAGDKDFYTNIDRCNETLRRLPEGSELLVCHGAGHVMWLEKDYYHNVRDTYMKFLKN